MNFAAGKPWLRFQQYLLGRLETFKCKLDEFGTPESEGVIDMPVIDMQTWADCARPVLILSCGLSCLSSPSCSTLALPRYHLPDLLPPLLYQSGDSCV